MFLFIMFLIFYLEMSLIVWDLIVSFNILIIMFYVVCFFVLIILFYIIWFYIKMFGCFDVKFIEDNYVIVY